MKRPGQRHLLLLFTAATLCCPALGGGSVYTSEKEVKVDENQPATLSCYYSGFSSPRVEWKFVQGSTTSLVCYDSKITVPPSKPSVNIPSSGTIGHRVVLTCSEENGSPPPQYQWFRDGVLMPEDPKKSRVFTNSSYTINSKTGELVFNPLSAYDTGEYSCQVYNGVGTAMRSEAIRLEAAELNVGGIVAAVIVTLILLGLLVFGVWFAYSQGYFNRTSKGSTSKKVIYSQPSARSDGDFRQTSSFLV
uniref:Junctional adhesion molecule A n=1 Tax=Sarcophilus harrisii TaxID=9305 RepID=A0A7N4PGW5_SARHA